MTRQPIGEFDPSVTAAMAKWPNVPAVFGWLRLDRRGQWHLIDRGQPGFDPIRHGRGSPITSPPILAFIARNYGATDDGRWFWQNGPQRVFVDLDLGPRIIRLLGEGAGSILVDHTGLPMGEIHEAALDSDGVLWLRDERGPGAVHDLDLAGLSIAGEGDDTLELLWHGCVLPIGRLNDPPTDLGFVRQPRLAQ